VAGGVENESTVDHPGNAVVETLTLSLDAREPHGREARLYRTKDKSVTKKLHPPPIFDLSLLAVRPYSLSSEDRFAHLTKPIQPKRE
jgi:hypothetical protein